ncbi:hypothetical protein [Halobacteriovorax sp. JY17]|uniref:hypothetical protein n=1 Tax=Halobacteriovorax sp. JY17 TaxID=2014617 RepID=UPI000C4CEA4F|nr:hypothetical protein [Halobacteriovorax sp. JY17]PIK13555.1 MAG: hypothetical protein CES88_15305 [Halobacteriovorax sp. JY17]
MSIKLLLTIFVLMSNFAFGQTSPTLEICMTHGDCQDRVPVEEGVKCYIVKTGTTPSGKQSCSQRCYTSKLGSYCKPIQGEDFGYCKHEKDIPEPTFDANDPNQCDTAIDLPF